MKKALIIMGITLVMAIIAVMAFPMGKIIGGIILICGLASLRGTFKNKDKK